MAEGPKQSLSWLMCWAGYGRNCIHEGVFRMFSDFQLHELEKCCMLLSMMLVDLGNQIMCTAKNPVLQALYIKICGDIKKGHSKRCNAGHMVTNTCCEKSQMFLKYWIIRYKFNKRLHVGQRSAVSCVHNIWHNLFLHLCFRSCHITPLPQRKSPGKSR